MMCVCGSLGSCLYTVENGWLGREKYVLETESNSLSEHTTGNTSPTTTSLVMSQFRKLKLAHVETYN